MKLAVILLSLILFPQVVRAATPPAALGASDAQIAIAGDVIKAMIQGLPAWDADPLGRYERAEIAAVRFDIRACEMAASTDDFWIDFEKLRQDLGVLLAVDDSFYYRLRAV